MRTPAVVFARLIGFVIIREFSCPLLTAIRTAYSPKNELVREISLMYSPNSLDFFTNSLDGILTESVWHKRKFAEPGITSIPMFSRSI